ncbi:hypothetical protein JOD03_000654 [Chryseomicrobium aureum]|uniref:hypothetical protein n=1 Tax=Chryseomicrobium aureum TaxID=1441723 RepID=UPI00195918BE|nr:hypothetical protein [Chryseomicrobium aureum]MBM7705753.1 hypothetical protein [Chryseomicrobium aureum]
MGAEIFGTIILWILGLLVLHFVIYTAVRDGINKSVVGQYINETKRYLSQKQFGQSRLFIGYAKRTRIPALESG